MANLEETREWAEGIYQLEKTDRVLGGTDGVANRQGQQLANRTLWLKEKVESTESALTEHKEADDPHPQYVTEQKMTDYVGTVIVQGQVNADWNATDGAACIKNKPVLSAVATSGNYADLNGKPTLSAVATSGSYNDLKDIPQAIPTGFIGMWSGGADAIPSGWWLCNGENGTPDLRDRFIIGAGGSYAVGSAGGNATQTVTLSGQTGATTLTVEQMPSHAHAVQGCSFEGSGAPLFTGRSNQINLTNATTSAGGSQPHAHSLTGTADVSILPPYYALCFIMKQ